jgi:hypothetical protein
MDEAETVQRVREHAEAVERGDMEAAGADFVEELQAQVPQIAQTLPLPVTSAAVVSLDIGDSESVAVIRYVGDSGEITVRTRWQDRDGRPMIVAGEPLT